MARVMTFPVGKGTAQQRRDVPWIEGVDRGLFCHRHFSWLCGFGQGKCQDEFFGLLVRIGQETRWRKNRGRSFSNVVAR